FLSVLFFNATPTTVIYTLSLHDALPIYLAEPGIMSADLASLPAATHHEGEIVQGTIVKITDTDVLVDVGMKSEGVLPVGEFKTQDRKSTRLNSSHVAISYAVFCLKKKKQ